jgi:ubiquitin conjugation factor E4 B
MEASIFDNIFLSGCLQFYALSSQWMLSVIDPSSHSLSPPEHVPMEFASLPEYFVEDIADFIVFILRFIPSVLDKVYMRDITNLLVLLVSCSNKFITNPYLVAKLIEVMYSMTPGHTHPNASKMMDMILSCPVGCKHLAPALMKFFSDVETTGASSEFFDKFSIRHHITTLCKQLWRSPAHHDSVVQLSSDVSIGSTFIRFINMLMNDTTFLLDESLDCLKAIHETQDAMTDEKSWMEQPQELQDSRQRQLQSDERKCRSYLTLAMATLDMMHYLSQSLPCPFRRPELIDRLAIMLNFNLTQLCGPKCRDLKVKIVLKKCILQYNYLKYYEMHLSNIIL